MNEKPGALLAIIYIVYYYINAKSAPGPTFISIILLISRQYYWFLFLMLLIFLLKFSISSRYLIFNLPKLAKTCQICQNLPKLASSPFGDCQNLPVPFLSIAKTCQFPVCQFPKFANSLFDNLTKSIIYLFLFLITFYFDIKNRNR